MCLMLIATASSSGRETLGVAAREASAAGLSVELEPRPRWFRTRNTPARAVISETGGCACSLLSDEADWNADVWAMRPEVLERLGRTLEILAETGPNGLAVEALWAGEAPRVTVRVSPSELAALARSSALGTRTRYEIRRAAGTLQRS